MQGFNIKNVKTCAKGRKVAINGNKVQKNSKIGSKRRKRTKNLEKWQ